MTQHRMSSLSTAIAHPVAVEVKIGFSESVCDECEIPRNSSGLGRTRPSF